MAAPGSMDKEQAHSDLLQQMRRQEVQGERAKYGQKNTCIDRCVAKYWQVTNQVGQLLGSQRPM